MLPESKQQHQLIVLKSNQSLKQPAARLQTQDTHTQMLTRTKLLNDLSSQQHSHTQSSAGSAQAALFHQHMETKAHLRREAF